MFRILMRDAALYVSRDKRGSQKNKKWFSEYVELTLDICCEKITVQLITYSYLNRLLATRHSKDFSWLPLVIIISDYLYFDRLLTSNHSKDFSLASEHLLSSTWTPVSGSRFLVAFDMQVNNSRSVCVKNLWFFMLPYDVLLRWPSYRDYQVYIPVSFVFRQTGITSDVSIIFFNVQCSSLTRLEFFASVIFTNTVDPCSSKVYSIFFLHWLVSFRFIDM